MMEKSDSLFTRRSVLTTFSTTAAAAAIVGLPIANAAEITQATSEDATPSQHGRPFDPAAIVAVILDLESVQGWEASGVACAKAYAAYRIRQAMGLDLPDPELARGHLQYQKGVWDAYKGSAWYERDQQMGKLYTAPKVDL